MSSKQFDYAGAWREVARPAWDVLPADVRALVAEVAEVAGGLHQLPDLTMPWPNDPQLPDDKRIPHSDLRVRFSKIPAEFLAFASRAVYFLGHWYPGAGKVADGFDFPGRDQGSHWKFSHYADQSLRDRLIAATSADAMRNNGPFQIHQGAIRICYSSRNMWTWEEVAPATRNGLERARKLYEEMQQATDPADRRHTRQKDHNVYQWFEALKSRDMVDLDWPREWWPFVQTEAYMREPEEIQAAEVNWENELSKVVAQHHEEIRKSEERYHAMRWCLDQRLPIDNAIWYDHTKTLCFGWREKVGPAFERRVLGVISEWQGAYEIRCADGRVLRNAQAEINRG